MRVIKRSPLGLFFNGENMKYPAVYVYKRTSDKGQELKYSIRSLENVKNWNGEVFVAGDREDWFSDEIKLIEAPKSHIKHKDVGNKRMAIAQDDRVQDDFIYFNDDLFCLPNLCLYSLNDDISFDIMDVYEMYSRWLREEDTSEEPLQSSLPENGQSRSAGEPTAGKSEKPKRVLGGEVRKEGIKQESLPDAPKEIQVIRGDGGGRGASRISWHEVDSDIQDMAQYEAEVHKSENQWLQELRWQGDNTLREMAYLFWILRRHGRSTTEEKPRPYRQRKGLLQRELPVGNAESADEKHQEKPILDLQRAETLYRRVGGKDWNILLQVAEIWGFGFREKRAEIKPLHQGELKEIPDINQHQKIKNRTREYLLDKGIEPLDYDLHVPMILNKQKILQMRETVGIPPQTPFMSFRSIYGNLFNIGGEYYEDRKTATNKLLKGDLLSTRLFAPELKELFKTPSKFERIT